MTITMSDARLSFTFKYATTKHAPPILRDSNFKEWILLLFFDLRFLYSNYDYIFFCNFNLHFIVKDA